MENKSDLPNLRTPSSSRLVPASNQIDDPWLHLFACLRKCLQTPFSPFFRGYHKNILIKFHIYAQGILCTRAANLQLWPEHWHKAQPINHSNYPYIIITHSSQCRSLRACGTFLSAENESRASGPAGKRRKIFWNYSMRAVSISFRRFTVPGSPVNR